MIDWKNPPLAVFQNSIPPGFLGNGGRGLLRLVSIPEKRKEKMLLSLAREKGRATIDAWKTTTRPSPLKPLFSLCSPLPCARWLSPKMKRHWKPCWLPLPRLTMRRKKEWKPLKVSPFSTLQSARKQESSMPRLRLLMANLSLSSLHRFNSKRKKEKKKTC